MSATATHPAEDLAVAFTLAGATRRLRSLRGVRDLRDLRAGERVALPLLLSEPTVAGWARECRAAGHELLLVGRHVAGPLLLASGGPCFGCARRQALLGALPAGLAEAGHGLEPGELATLVAQVLANVPWAALAGAVLDLRHQDGPRERWRLARLAGCQDCGRPVPLAEVFYATQLFEIHQGGRA